MGEDDPRARAWAAQLVATHQRLRDALALARETLEAGGRPDVAAAGRDLTLYCIGFCAALGGHHAAEDDVLLPAVVRAHPRLADVVGYLRSDHAQLDHLLGALRLALERGEPAGALLRHLDGVEAIMESHFGYEERQLLGVLADLGLDVAPDVALGPLA